MKKSYFLGLAMLLGVTGEGYAQVKIANPADLIAAKDSLSKMITYNARISENTGLINSFTIELGKQKPTVIEKEVTRVPYGTVEKSAINAFADKLMYGNGEDSSLKIKIVQSTGGWVTTSTLYIYSSGQDVSGDSDVKTVSTNGLQPNGLDLVGSSGSSVGAIVIYYKRTDKAGNETYKEYYYGLSSAATTNAGVLPALKSAVSNIPEGEDDVEKEVEIENEVYTTLMNNIASYKTQNSYYTALINGGNWTVYAVENGAETEKTSETSIAKGCATFKNLILADNINSLPDGFTMGVWGEDYVFNGNGYSIESTSTSLFGTNNGVIENLGVLGGNVVTRNNGTIKNSYEKPSGSNLYNIYDEDGNRTSNQQLSAELAHKLRNTFGMDLSSGTLSLSKVTNENKVFMVQYATHEDKTGTTFYTNINNGYISQSPVSDFEKKNIFYYVEDADGREMTQSANVVCKNGNVYECSTAVITDKGDNMGIFILKDFTAAKVDYKRNVTTDIASVCFPFTVDYDVMKAKGVKNVMQFNGVEAATGIYWFKYMTGSLLANQPYLVSFDVAPNSNVFDGLANVKFSATPDVNLYELAPAVDNTVGGNLRGTLVQTTASVLAASQYDIYGYSATTGDFVKMADKATFGVCRAYVRSPRSTAAAKSFALGFLDENGNVVNGGGTTGIGSITGTEDNGFSVKGGNGMIYVNAGKAQKVNVYTVGGSLVKSSTVEAGSASIPVASGMYIVNGKKVVVK